MDTSSERDKPIVTNVLLGGHLGERVVLLVPTRLKVYGQYAVVWFQLNSSRGGASRKLR